MTTDTRQLYTLRQTPEKKGRLYLTRLESGTTATVMQQEVFNQNWCWKRRHTIADWLRLQHQLSQTVWKHSWTALRRDLWRSQCKLIHRPWWLPRCRTCPVYWCGWWYWCWAGRPRWGGWRWRRVTAAGSAGSTSRWAEWPDSPGWSCWGRRRSCGIG